MGSVIAQPDFVHLGRGERRLGPLRGHLVLVLGDSCGHVHGQAVHAGHVGGNEIHAAFHRRAHDHPRNLRALDPTTSAAATGMLKLKFTRSGGVLAGFGGYACASATSVATAAAS
jgi:hypothetical protein